MFVLVNFGFLLFLQMFVQSFSSTMFLPWILSYYVFWFGFFRRYYKRRPYIFSGKIFGTFGPSAKMMLMLSLLLIVLMLVPFTPLLFEYNEEYALFLDKYMSNIRSIDMGEGISHTNIGTLLVLFGATMILSPLVIIRPMFAWISSLIGRSGSMHNAFSNSRGNYFQFLFLTLIFEIPSVAVEFLFSYYELNPALEQFIISPLIVLGNIVIAKAYDFFFLSPEQA